MKDSVLTFLLRMFRSRQPLEGGEAEVRRGSDICAPPPSYITAATYPGHRLWTPRPSFKPRDSPTETHVDRSPYSAPRDYGHRHEFTASGPTVDSVRPPVSGAV